MATLGELHSEFRGLLGADANSVIGVGVSTTLLEIRLRRLAHNLANYSRVTPSPPELGIPDLSGRLTADPNSIHLRLDTANQKIMFDCDLKLAIVPTRANTVVFDTIIYPFRNVELALTNDSFLNGEFRFDLKSASTPSMRTQGPYPGNPSQLNEADITNPAYTNYTTVDQYKSDERIIMLLGWKSILQSFIEESVFPRFRRAMRTFMFSAPYRVLVGNNHIYISGTPQLLVPDCAHGGSAENQLTLKMVEPVDDGKGSNSGSEQAREALEFTFEFAGTMPQTAAPATLTDPHTVLYYPGNITLVDLATKQLRPGVTVQDSGIASLVRWWYEASASLLNLRVALDVASSSIVITVDWNCFANAGANLKVGCVETNVANITVFTKRGVVEGDVDLALENTAVVLTSGLRRTDITRIVVGGLPFPLDIVANWLGTRVAEYFLKRVLARTLDSVRAVVLNVPDMYGEKSTSGEKHVLAESVAFGLNFGADIVEP